MSKPVSQESLNQIFAEARSHHAWTSRPVAEETLRSLYEVMKWGPTSVNSLPARVVFVQSEAARKALSSVDELERAAGEGRAGHRHHRLG